ncbi:hypothetical protein ACSMXN_08090 [Jatrophihabitans sp. DSM 45814]
MVDTELVVLSETIQSVVRYLLWLGVGALTVAGLCQCGCYGLYGTSGFGHVRSGGYRERTHRRQEAKRGIAEIESFLNSYPSEPNPKPPAE